MTTSECTCPVCGKDDLYLSDMAIWNHLNHHVKSLEITWSNAQRARFELQGREIPEAIKERLK